MHRTQVGSAAHSLATQTQTGYQAVFISAWAGGYLGRWGGGAGVWCIVHVVKMVSERYKLGISFVSQILSLF